MTHELWTRCRTACLLLAPLGLAACREPLQCTSVSVVERLDVKLDREMRENVLFLGPHEPDRSRFDVSDLAQRGTQEGALACTAELRAVLDASPAFARTHGFPPPHAHTVDRKVRFTAHRGRWDTYVEVVGVDPLAAPAAQAEARSR